MMSVLRRCQFCQNPYDEKVPRTIHELEPLRQVLFITGPAVNEDVAACDGCYEKVVYTPNRVNGHTGLLDVGGSNHGPPNLLLRGDAIHS
jgi:hypothetical protein